MKQFFFFVVVWFLSANVTTAQKNKPDINLGIKLGANFSQLNGETWESGYKTNLLGGAFFGVAGSRVGIALEGLFSQSQYVTGGGKFYNAYKNYYNPLVDSLKKGTFRVNYLNIPLLVQVRLLSALWLQFGPQYSGVVSVEDKDNLLRDAKGLFKNGDMSGVLGVNIRLPAHLVVSGRYIFGLTDIRNANFKSLNTSLSDEWKQRMIQITLGYDFL